MKNLVVSNLPNFLKPYWVKLQASPLGYRLAKGTFWSLVGTFISRGLALIASIIIARLIGKVQFGELGIIQSTVGMLAAFAGLGMGLTANKHVAEFKASQPARAGRVIVMSSIVAWVSGALMSLTLLGGAGWLAEHTLAAPRLEPLLQIASLLLFFSAINGAQTGALAGFEAFKRIAKVNLLSGLASFPITLAGVMLFGLRGAVWGLVATQALTCILGYFAVRAEARNAGVGIDFHNPWKEWRVLWHFSLPAMLGSLLTSPVYWLCSTMLVKLPGGYAEMGVFNAANQWFSALIFLPQVLGQAVLPMLSQSMGEHDHLKCRKLLWLAIRVNALVSIPILIVGSLASPAIMAWYGSGFGEHWPTLIIVLATAALLALQSPIGHIVTATGRMWQGALMNLGWGLAFLVSAWFLVRYGAMGLASARFSSYVLHGIWTFAFAYHVLSKFNPQKLNTNPRASNGT